MPEPVADFARRLTSADPTVTFTVYAALWIARRASQGGWRPQTAINYRYMLTHYLAPLIGDVPLVCITRGVVRDVLGEMQRRGLSSATRKLARAVMSAVCEDALDHEILAHNPAHRIRIAHRAVRDRIALPELVLRRYVEAFYLHYPRIAPIVGGCGFGGMRIGESIALHRDVFDGPNRKLQIVRSVLESGWVMPAPKGTKPRTIVVGDSLYETLEPVVRDARDWLYPGKYGLIRYTTVSRAIAEVCAKLDLPRFGSHTMRRSYATIHRAQGVPMAAIQCQLGHATQAQTEAYIDAAVPLDHGILTRLLHF